MCKILRNHTKKKRRRRRKKIAWTLKVMKVMKVTKARATPFSSHHMNKKLSTTSTQPSSYRSQERTKLTTNSTYTITSSKTTTIKKHRRKRKNPQPGRIWERRRMRPWSGRGGWRRDRCNEWCGGRGPGAGRGRGGRCGSRRRRRWRRGRRGWPWRRPAAFATRSSSTASEATATAAIEWWMGFGMGVEMGDRWWCSLLSLRFWRRRSKVGSVGGWASPLGVVASRVHSAFIFDIAFCFKKKNKLTCLGRLLFFPPARCQPGRIVIEFEMTQ